MNFKSHIKLISLIVLLLLGSCSFAYSIIGRPLNYYYELNYNKNSIPTLTRKKHVDQRFVNVNNKIPKYKTKKRFLYNTENRAPATFSEYLSKSKEIKRTDVRVPEPTFDKDAKIIDLPDPNLRVVKYNNPPGSVDINLSDLVANSKVNSVGVLSPDYSKMVYSVANYCAPQHYVSSEMYYIDLSKMGSIKNKLQNANIIQRDRTPLISSGD